MKTYVLTVSRVFPTTHKRKGEETGFISKIFAAIKPNEDFNDLIDPKIHTVRANYELWKKRIEQVQKGEAILSIRYWSGKPYNSKQVEICQLDKDSGIGVQKIELDPFGVNYKIDDGKWIFDNGHELAKNDGLSLEDFKEWFRKYNLSKPMAIIHFTKFRY